MRSDEYLNKINSRRRQKSSFFKIIWMNSYRALKKQEERLSAEVECLESLFPPIIQCEPVSLKNIMLEDALSSFFMYNNTYWLDIPSDSNLKQQTMHQIQQEDEELLHNLSLLAPLDTKPFDKICSHFFDAYQKHAPPSERSRLNEWLRNFVPGPEQVLARVHENRKRALKRTALIANHDKKTKMMNAAILFTEQIKKPKKQEFKIKGTLEWRRQKTIESEKAQLEFEARNEECKRQLKKMKQIQQKRQEQKRQKLITLSLMRLDAHMEHRKSMLQNSKLEKMKKASKLLKQGNLLRLKCKLKEDKFKENQKCIMEQKSKEQQRKLKIKEYYRAKNEAKASVSRLQSGTKSSLQSKLREESFFKLNGYTATTILSDQRAKILNTIPESLSTASKGYVGEIIKNLSYQSNDFKSNILI